MANSLSYWNHTSNLTNQLNETITPAEAIRRYGAAATATKTIIETNESGQLVAIDSAEILKSIYGIADGLTDAEFIDAILAAREAQNAPAPDPVDELLDELEGELNG